jgi:phosphomannomutase
MVSQEANVLETIRDSSLISAEARASIERWLDDPELRKFEPAIRELVDAGQFAELEDAFYTHLSIGTGGIRGKIGPGPNRINVRTIGEAAQGLTRFIESQGASAKNAGVVVGHEARRLSEEFATLCCEVFAASGIRSFLFHGLRSTPEVSFAVRDLHATAGVQITASHNPRTDNGFKFYWSDGGQVVPPYDAAFMRCVAEVRDIHRMPIDEARQKGLVLDIGREVDERYFAAVRGLSLEPSRSATIVFSPIHGAGVTNVLPILREEGFAVSTVAEQLAPDATFPTAVGDLINPEYREVMELAIRQAERESADLALCSDPDADRVGVAAKIHQNESTVQVLSGNQIAAALTYYLLSRRQERGRLSERDLVIETCVTTTLVADVARGFGLRPVDDLLVGFKFIAEIIEKLENPSEFVLGAEESLGYLVGTFVRDKDASIASLMIAEMTSWLKDNGRTLLNYLDEIYQRYGYYCNLQHVVELPGKTGSDIMRAILLRLRHAPPATIGGLPVVQTVDRLAPELADPARYRLGNAGDILTFVLSADGRSRITLRPSGTEPKLKYYVQHYAPVEGSLTTVKAAIDSAAATIAADMVDLSQRGLTAAALAEWRRSHHRTV